ncbi:MAG TPA: sensor histidine kinase KdpD, partial [Spirochaetia bacterium]|nr:sensor histidine kinase KdpD [Spirochaetia bacterium]
ELLPKRSDRYRDILLSEFDLDAALSRRPAVLILDELAHTNAPWCRHKARYQDAIELLDAGIEVFTTMNVQHLESLNDIVAGITGIVVQETVPDSLFDEAASIELVDLPPEELMERFRDGKVYVPQQAKRAMSAFFRRENLLALREIALRRTAERVNRDVQTSRLATAAGRVWRTRELLLVAVSASDTSATLIRRARRMAAAFAAPWIACSVNTGGFRRPGDRERLTRNLALAERLGAEVQTLQGENAAQAILEYAMRRNVTRIVIGKNQDTWLGRLLRRGIAEQLLRRSGDIDIYVIRGQGEDSPPPPPNKPKTRSISWFSLALTLVGVALATGISVLFRMAHFTEPNVIMTYVLEVFMVALFLGWAPGVVASVCSVLAFNFFFTEPYYTFVVYNAEYIVTFLVMLAVSLVTSSLVQRVRRQIELTRGRQQRAETLYRLSANLASAGGAASIRNTAERQLSALLGAEVIVARRPEVLVNEEDAAVARWVVDHGEAAGHGTGTLPGVGSIFLPLPGSESTLGVLVVPIKEGVTELLPDHRQLLETVASLVAVTIEREELAEKARRMILDAEHERSQNVLLRAISHDLRTPLATIIGSAEMLEQGGIDEETSSGLVSAIDQEAKWLAKLVENLLQLTRLDTEGPSLKRTPETIDDIVSSAISHFDRKLTEGRLLVFLPEDIVMIEVDPTLLQEVIINLVDNALKYSEPATSVELAVQTKGSSIDLSVSDRGWGVKSEEIPHLFDRFYRGSSSKQVRGTGLGLAICRAIVRAHGGEIQVMQREGGGTIVVVRLPARRTDDDRAGIEPTAAPRPRDR